MSNMRYASPKKSGKGGKGFFVALGVCLIAVGAAASLPTKMSHNIFPAAVGFLTAAGVQSGIHPAGRQYGQRRQGDRQQRLLQRGGVLCGGIRA